MTDDKIRVLFADTDRGVCAEIEKELDTYEDIKLNTIYYAEDIAACLSEIHYSVVIADKDILSDADVERIFSYAQGTGEAEIILTTEQKDESGVYALEGYEPVMLLRKPIDPSLLLMLIRRSDELRRLRGGYVDTQTSDDDIGIDEVLSRIGVPGTLKGRKYLRDAVRIVTKRPGALEHVTKLLYPQIAQRNNTTSVAVERQIRRTVSVCWERGDVDVMRQYFGNAVSRKKGRPTSSEFISGVVQIIRCKKASEK